MIPPLDAAAGLLPPGIHTASWDEGELFPARVAANHLGNPFLDFFQYDTRTAQQKGIVVLNLEGLR